MAAGTVKPRAIGTHCAGLRQVCAISFALGVACGGVVEPPPTESLGADGGTFESGSSDAPSAAVDSSFGKPISDAGSSTLTDSGSCPPAVSTACWYSGLGWGVGKCELAVEPYVAEDPELIGILNVAYRGLGWMDASPQDGHLTFVGTVDRCSKYPYGWYFDTAATDAGMTVRLCPGACACVQADESAGIMAELGCATFSAPEVGSTLAPAKCAAARKKPCASAYTWLSQQYPKCNEIDFDAELVPHFDEINVVLRDLADASKDGYVSYVASPNECGAVTEGWYFVPGSSPPKIGICPSTCSCAKTKPARFFEIVLGCSRWSELKPDAGDGGTCSGCFK